MNMARRACVYCPCRPAFTRAARLMPMACGCVSGGGLKSASVMSRPASSRSTSRPRSVSSLTAMLPDAPEPMTRASYSASVRVLVLAATTVLKRGGALVLLRPVRAVARMLEITGANQVITVRGENEARAEPEPGP